MWMDINTLSLKLEILKDIPTHMKPAVKLINKRTYDSAKTNDDRRLTYFYVNCDSPIASPLVEPLKQPNH